MAKKSILEADLLAMSEAELKEYTLNLFEKQRRLKDSRKDDPTILEYMEYCKTMYGEPGKDTENAIKTARKVFRLREIQFNFEGV